MTNAEKGKRHFSLIDSWLNISISSKTLIVQIVLLVIPLAVCIIMFSSVMYLNLAQQSAQKSYQYCRYVVDTFETDMLRIKAISNVIASSQQTTVFLTLADETKADEYYDKAKALITGASANHSKVRNTVLYATEYASPAARERLPLWSAAQYTGWYFTANERENGSDTSWIQTVYKDAVPVGVIEMQLTRYIFSDITDSIAKIIGGDCIIKSSKDNGVFYSTSADQAELDKLKNLQMYAEGYHALSFSDYAITIYCDAVGLAFVATGTAEPSYHMILGSIRFLIYIVAVLLITMFISAYLNYVGVTKRIKLLNKQICLQSQVKQLDSLRPIEIAGEDEIGILARNYNQLQKQLVEISEQERMAQAMQQTARFSALQAQIQPHFLYNTLETLRMMADEHDDNEVADMLFVLGKLMRSCISGKEQEIELTRELENIKNYLMLNKLRYSNLDYEIICDADIANMKCPRFILQPLVENSVHHGISRSKGNRYVQVHIYRQENYLLIDVQDNGVGISPDRLAEIKQSLGTDKPLNQEQGGIGIMNVHKRLKMFYGENSGIELFSTPDEGTLCRVRIQADKKEKWA